MSGRDLQLTVFGVSGRMGRAVIAAAEESPGVAVKGTTTSAGDPAAALRGADVAIEFALPQATAANLAACVAAKRPLVIGTTGHDEAQRAQIAAAAKQIAIVMAPNMSLGVNVLLKLVELTAGKLDANYDIEIFDAHHRGKKDAPSGTALALGAAAAAGRGVQLSDSAEYARHGAGEPRRRGAIGFSVFRGGDVVGDHTVTFAGAGERIELTHRASDRMAFARGAVQAARWLVGKSPGLYSMQDVLGLV
ncbi:MAG TPA: 4-hydroxy-tetrahydrodipicolinate reductase [Steroidobacteraceae bacterium]|nr:4-hydroxy-tetrahydrodipicolinate reductase [Steroidobacteraceae bacterium]